MYNQIRRRAIRLAKSIDNRIQSHIHSSDKWFWDFITSDGVDELGVKPEGEQISIDWLIPSFSPGSGGHTTIFRIIRELERRGHNQRIFVVGPTTYTSGAEAFKVINNFFFPINTPVFLSSDGAGSADVAVATSWLTAYYVRSLPGVGRKWYFVQDFEPYFYAHGAEYLFAEDTYRFGFHGITAGPWLAEKLGTDYGMDCKYFFLATDPIYKLAPAKKVNKNIVFYARHVTPRRSVELGILALSKIHRKYPDWNIYMFGTDAFEVPFPCTFLGVLDHNKLVQLYHESTIGVVLSSTNYSLIPNEMMASGLAVVELDTECMRMVYQHGEHIMLSKPNVEGLSTQIERLILDRDLRNNIAEQGAILAKSWTWEEAADSIERAFRGV